ncbi:transmembrane protein, putative [Medicago truncatula]|uniref:Transmembrane protein, putative n=1 Tax=Medicago truncatula TaxID=3880 RepID=G7J2S8_MEDTR|nr:transmembrane protein, putative [Medicago truncatula]
MESDALTLLALQGLKAPLYPNPITHLDKFVNRLRVQYRTLQLEFRVIDVSAILLILCYLFNLIPCNSSI